MADHHPPPANYSMAPPAERNSRWGPAVSATSDVSVASSSSKQISYHDHQHQHHHQPQQEQQHGRYFHNHQSNLHHHSSFSHSNSFKYPDHAHNSGEGDDLYHYHRHTHGSNPKTFYRGNSDSGAPSSLFGGLNMQDADKIAFGRSFLSPAPQQQQRGRENLLLPQDRWNSDGESSFLWDEHRDAASFPVPRDQDNAASRNSGIWPQASAQFDDQSRTSSRDSLSVDTNHNNTTLLAGNPRSCNNSTSGESRTTGQGEGSAVCSTSSLWPAPPSHSSRHLPPSYSDGQDSFSNSLSQLSMKQPREARPPLPRGATYGSGDDDMSHGPFYSHKQHHQQTSITRRDFQDLSSLPVNDNRRRVSTDPAEEHSLVTNNSGAARFPLSSPSLPRRRYEGEDEDGDDFFSSSPPPSYFLPSASFLDHPPAFTSSSNLGVGGSTNSPVAELVPASSASTYTNESLLNITLGSCPSPTTSVNSFSASVTTATNNASNLVPPTPPLGAAGRSISMVLPNDRYTEQRKNTQNQVRRKESSINNRSDGVGGGGRRKNNNRGGGGSNRKQPRSSSSAAYGNPPSPPLKERNSPPGKRSKESEAMALRNKDSNSDQSSSSPSSAGTAEQLGKASSEAVRQLVKPRQGQTRRQRRKQKAEQQQAQAQMEEQQSQDPAPYSLSTRGGQGSPGGLTASSFSSENRPILPLQRPEDHADYSFQYNDFELDDSFVPVDPNGDPLFEDDENVDDDNDDAWSANPYGGSGRNSSSPSSKKHEWLLRMNRRLQETPVGELDCDEIPITAVMNAWAKSKSAQGASMVELWLLRAQQEADAGNKRIVPTNKMYTMAVDAWARSGEGGAAAQRAESLLQQMNELYQQKRDENIRPTTGIFNAVINAWARSKERIAPVRAEQILNWMQSLNPDLGVQPDKYTFNTVIHAYAKAGGTEAAEKAQDLLAKMHKLYQEGNQLAKPDTITYNVVINCWAKGGGKGAAAEAEKLLTKMHQLHAMGDAYVKPNVVTYGAVIDAFAKSGESGAASRADTLLARMIELYQSDPVGHAGLMPNTYVFNTVINCWAKSKETDAASKAEEMLVAMSRLHSSGMPSLKPDAFTYTAVIDAWAKSGYRGAASRADQLLDKMEAKYLAGDLDLKPNTFTYNAVINALAKSGEAGAAARAERVLQNMVNRHRNGGGGDVKPTTINFNTVLDAWAKSGGGRAAAERAEEILEWMDRLHKQGNEDVKPDTITFNAVLDAWARSGDRVAPRRAEQILDHMDELYRAGNLGVKPDTYTYNTLINAWAKAGERGSAARAEHVLSVMEKRYRDGDSDFKPNTRTHTSVIDAWAKSGEKGAAARANQILNNMITRYEATGDIDAKPNVHTANAVCNACAFSKHEEDRVEALQIAFRVFDWLGSQDDMEPDSYTYTILLSVCANLIPRHDTRTRYAHARSFFVRCRDAGYVNDFVIRKLRQTVSEQEFAALMEYRTESSAGSMPASWSRNVRLEPPTKSQSHHNRKGKWQGRRRG